MSVIERKVRDFLKLRRPPPHLKDEPSREALRVQIIKIVEDRKPDHGVDAWIGEVIERAMMKQKGSGWPSPDVWSIAVGGATRQAKADEPRRDPMEDIGFKTFVRRVQNGEPVSEHDLFGRRAERALREQAISFSELRARQRGAFIARRSTYGEAQAFKWLDEQNPALAEEMKKQREAAERELRPQHASDEERDLIGGEFDV